MIIKITECEANYGGKDLFADLAEYDTILDWVKALIDGTADYTPLDCWVRIDENTVFSIRSAGQLSQEDADACLGILRRMPKRMQRLPRDKGSIVADIFEHELVISLI